MEQIRVFRGSELSTGAELRHPQVVSWPSQPRTHRGNPGGKGCPSSRLSVLCKGVQEMLFGEFILEMMRISATQTLPDVGID